MSIPRFLVVFSVVFVFLFPFFVFEGLSSSSEDVAGLAISQAEEVLASAYGAVLEAEQAGADVSDLLVRLNDAGELLAMAQVAFRLGDFGEAVRCADLCYEIGGEVKSKAYELRLEAHGMRTTGFWLAMTGSLVGVVAVVFGSFWGWHAFKRRYFQRVLRMKPEVAKDES